MTFLVSLLVALVVVIIIATPVFMLVHKMKNDKAYHENVEEDDIQANNEWTVVAWKGIDLPMRLEEVPIFQGMLSKQKDEMANDIRLKLKKGIIKKVETRHGVMYESTNKKINAFEQEYRKNQNA
jgi:hypothetical protein